jgi:hypothetical protein
MTDAEVNKIIEEKRCKLDQKESSLMSIPKPRFNIGDTVKLFIDLSNEDVGIVYESFFCIKSKIWEHSIAMKGFGSATHIPETFLDNANIW